MGVTATGLPYPEPTDPVAAGADNIKNLAIAIGVHIQAGVHTYTTAGAGGSTITFPVPFAAAPVVSLTVLAGTGYSWTAQITNVTATAVGIQSWRGGTSNPAGSSLTIHWVAVGRAP